GRPAGPGQRRGRGRDARLLIGGGACGPVLGHNGRRRLRPIPQKAGRSGGEHRMARADTGKKPTIYSIAQAVGVSPSTVSRVLSRPDLVKDSVREAVLAAAREHGYSPNRAARGLATGRT